MYVAPAVSGQAPARTYTLTECAVPDACVVLTGAGRATTVCQPHQLPRHEVHEPADAAGARQRQRSGRGHCQRGGFRQPGHRGRHCRVRHNHPWGGRVQRAEEKERAAGLCDSKLTAVRKAELRGVIEPSARRRFRADTSRPSSLDATTKPLSINSEQRADAAPAAADEPPPRRPASLIWCA